MTSILNPGYARQAGALMRIPAVAHGFSVEPLDCALSLPAELLRPTSWVIVGGESGVASRLHRFDLRWARSLMDQTRAAGASFFLKQLGGHPVDAGVPVTIADSHGGNWDAWPADLRVREIPAAFCQSADTAQQSAA